MAFAITTLSEARSHYSSLRSSGKLSGTITGALKKWVARSANKPAPTATPNRFARFRQLGGFASLPSLKEIPLGESCPVLSRYKAAQPRLRQWSLGQRPSILATHEITTGSNSDMKKRSTFQRGVSVLSAGTIVAGKLVYKLDNQPIAIIAAPRGYQWGTDIYGVRLVGKLGDYHPNSDDLTAANPGKQCVEMLRENAAKRKEAAKMAVAVEAATNDQSLYVCVADARRAGHCKPGIMGWISQQGLNSSRHYAAAVLKRIKDERLSIVLAFAARRHASEMQSGYCNLSDHLA